MYKYTIELGAEMTPDRMQRILCRFQTNDQPRYKKLKKYFEGKHNIIYKSPTDAGRPCNKVVVNYCKAIVDNYLGYITGKPITYTGENVEPIIDILNYNDVRNLDSELLKNALIYGIAYNINYIDGDGQQRIQVLDTMDCVPVYDDTLNSELAYVIRFWKETPVNKDTDIYIVEVYGANSVKTYKSVPGFTSFEFVNERPNFFHQVQITPFMLNTDGQSIFEQIITLNDAYNNLISGGIDSWDAFADAYMVLKGVTASEEDLKAMKETRCILLDNDADASYLTKNVSDTDVKDMMTNIDKKIHIISHSPDFTDEAFGTSSGIAIQYKLLDFENASAEIEAAMKKCLQRRVELFCEILNLTDTEATWRDVIIKFHRNLPVDMQTIVSCIGQLKGIISDETLISMIPNIENPEEEYKKLQEQKAKNAELYNFNVPDDMTEDEE